MGKSVLFVSEIKDPYYEDFSSTQIMTNNVIDGLIATSDYLTFVALIDANCSEKNVIDYYGEKVNKVFIVHSHLDLTLHKNKYEQLIKIAQSWIFASQYNKDLKELFLDVHQYDVLVSHSPTLEAIAISKQIKKRFGIKYIQYWSDPYTVAGILPENIGIKRKLHYILESSMLNIADDIVYGTKTLMEFQKSIFTNRASKMRFVDVAYCKNSNCSISPEKKENDVDLRLIYAGDYFSVTRNIEPLYNAVKNIDGCKLTIVGNSDKKLESTESIKIIPRQPYQVIQNYENASDVIVCLLNHSCIQIPGKIFYRVNTKQHILIVLDGKYKKQFREYLESFGRFEFCDNTIESIDRCLQSISTSEIEVNIPLINRLAPQKIGAELLNGGESVDK